MTMAKDIHNIKKERNLYLELNVGKWTKTHFNVCLLSSLYINFPLARNYGVDNVTTMYQILQIMNSVCLEE